MVEEGERLALCVTFKPQGYAAEFDGQRVLVHAINAMRDHVADCFAHAFRGGLVLACVHSRKFFA
jgi:hypothetical protein